MKQTFYPLGYPVQISSSSELAVQAAASLWGSWPLLFEVAPLCVEVRAQPVSPPATTPRFEPPARFSSDARNFAEFDIAAHSGRIHISEQALNTARFRHNFLEALVLTALDSVFFTPLHAACVSRDGEGILLCGDSGAGKSTLTFTCGRRGWIVVSDDATHLAPGYRNIGVGGSNIIHLREAARALFPEIATRRASAMPNGKQAIQIDAGEHGFRTARSARIGMCVFLARRPGPTRWREFSTSAAIDYFLKYLWPRETTHAESRLRVFLKTPPVSLEYEHAHDAAAALEALIEVAA